MLFMYIYIYVYSYFLFRHQSKIWIYIHIRIYNHTYCAFVCRKCPICMCAMTHSYVSYAGSWRWSFSSCRVKGITCVTVLIHMYVHIKCRFVELVGLFLSCESHHMCHMDDSFVWHDSCEWYTYTKCRFVEMIGLFLSFGDRKEWGGQRERPYLNSDCCWEGTGGGGGHAPPKWDVEGRSIVVAGRVGTQRHQLAKLRLERCCSELQWVAVSCSELQLVAVSCGALQCVAACVACFGVTLNEKHPLGCLATGLVGRTRKLNMYEDFPGYLLKI